MTVEATPGEATPPSAPERRWYAGLARQYVTVQLFWNPLVTGAAVLALSSAPSFFSAFVRSLVVAAVASTVCFVPVALALELEQRAREDGRRVKAHGRTWYMVLALLGMPVGLYLAAEVSELVFGVRAPATAFDYRFAAFLGTLIAGLFFLWQTLGDARRAALAAELELERAETHKLKAQLSALTAQLNPHLLFNALNTIASLVQTDPDRAERTVLCLADLYRGVLGATQRERHSLVDELQICQAYLDVEQARFRERLSIHVEVEPDLGAERVIVPVLVLQPLVENAVTHGLSDRARGGLVSIRAGIAGDTLELQVVDDGVGLGNSSRSGSGLGIDTTRQRLKLSYGERASLELSSPPSGGTRAVLHLPLQRS